MDITLVILAAGMASRYGSMKQTEGFGPGGETIMDYSVYDAIRSGFTKVVFIIRKDFSDSFRAVYDRKLAGKIKVAYVYQDLSSFVDAGRIPADRTKPWGTGHAIMCAGHEVKEPFAVINADDFYGRDAFEKAASFLRNDCNEATYAIIGYSLAGTLSDHGTVSRGVCDVDSEKKLVAINERTNIFRRDGVIYFDENGKESSLDAGSYVSMNFWCFHPSVFDFTAGLFREFIEKRGSELKSEFFIPIIADAFIRENKGEIRIIPTDASWFGVTYKEDAPLVKENLGKLINSGIYPERIWE